MMEWINANAPMLGLIATPIVVALIQLRGTRRDKEEIKAIAALEASNSHLSLLLGEARNRESEANAAKDTAERKYKIQKEQSDIAADTINRLQGEVSGLQLERADHPCLVKGRSAYQYAFPHGDKEGDVYFCADCWEENRVLTVLEKRGRSSTRFTGYCKVHGVNYV